MKRVFLLFGVFCFSLLNAQDAKQKVIKELKQYVDVYNSFAKRDANVRIIVYSLPADVEGLEELGFVTGEAARAYSRAYYLKVNDAASINKLNNLEQDALNMCDGAINRVQCAVYYIAPFEGRDIITSAALEEQATAKIRIYRQQVSPVFIDLKSGTFSLPFFLEKITKDLYEQVLTIVRSENPSLGNYNFQITPTVEIMEKSNNAIKLSPLLIKWLYIFLINEKRIKNPYYNNLVLNFSKAISRDRQATVAD